jgi:hypothetical protein
MVARDSDPGGIYSRLADVGYGPVRFTEEVAPRIPTPEEAQFLRLTDPQPVFNLWGRRVRAKRSSSSAIWRRHRSNLSRPRITSRRRRWTGRRLARAGAGPAPRRAGRRTHRRQPQRLAAGGVEGVDDLPRPGQLPPGGCEHLVQDRQLTRVDGRLAGEPQQAGELGLLRSPASSPRYGQTASTGGSIPAARDTTTRWERTYSVCWLPLPAFRSRCRSTPPMARWRTRARSRSRPRRALRERSRQRRRSGHPGPGRRPTGRPREFRPWES